MSGGCLCPWEGHRTTPTIPVNSSGRLIVTMLGQDRMVTQIWVAYQTVGGLQDTGPHGSWDALELALLPSFVPQAASVPPLQSCASSLCLKLGSCLHQGEAQLHRFGGTELGFQARKDLEAFARPMPLAVQHAGPKIRGKRH